ncbi:MAG: hypothetical protein QOI10_965 [Solirubrobacterales bacterium]|jgi:hypothetical protein|nr:hypothetical protein [Solirubrobacterales bacterium]
MSLGKRISESRERRAQARAKRRDERRRAERAKAATTPAERSKARAERAKAKEGAKADKAPKPERKKPAIRSRPRAEPKAKVAAASSPRAKPGKGEGEREGEPKRSARRVAVAKRRRSLAGDAKKVGGGVGSVGVEIAKLGREMVAIPVQLWLAAAEYAGAFVLKAWQRVVRPLLIAIWRLLGASVRFLDRHVTPARAVAAVGLVAAGALAASQWLDYHAVSVGTDAYSGSVGAIAPPPEIESEIAGNAHSWVMLPLAAAALVVITLALTGRRRAAALLIPIGIVVIAISLIVDVPKGLDEGSAAIAYEGASASLLEGFWMQIAAGAVLIFCGLLLPRYLRPVSARAAPAPTGPTLFETGAAAARKLSRRRPKIKLKRPRSRPRTKRKVQGAAGT